MQICENTDFALRVAVMELQRDERAPALTLYPMIHLGEKQFYETVRDELRTHDLMIYEGASGRAIGWLTQVYRQAALNRCAGLVLQSSVLRLRDIGIPHRRADLSAEDIDRIWAGVPFWWRWALQLGSLAVGLLFRYYGGRFVLRNLLTPIEDRRSLNDWETQPDDALHDARDAVLIAALDTAIAEGPRRIAVVYGAGHMRAVIRHLMGPCGYRITRARWFTVVTY